MKYLESAIRFSIKNWMLILPLFVLTALASLLSGIGSTASISALWSTVGNLNNLTNPGDMLSVLPGLLSAVALGSGIWAALFNFVTLPATYGLVNKGLETGSAGLNDIGSAISENFVKYVMYFVGTLVLGLALTIGFGIIFLILYLLTLLLKGVGVALMVIVFIALIVAGIIFAVLISMWYSAMVVDGLDVMAAAKKSIEVVKSCFWTVIGITLLVAVAAGIAGFILGLLRVIPLVGPIIYSAVPAAQTFVMAVFLLTLYREKTGRVNAI